MTGDDDRTRCEWRPPTSNEFRRATRPYIVTRFALNAVALRDDVGGLDHRQIQLGLVLGDPGSMQLAPLPVALRLWICEQLSTPPVIMTGTTLPTKVLWQVLATVERDVRTGVPIGNS